MSQSLEEGQWAPVWGKWVTWLGFKGTALALVSSFFLGTGVTLFDRHSGPEQCAHTREVMREQTCPRVGLAEPRGEELRLGSHGRWVWFLEAQCCSQAWGTEAVIGQDKLQWGGLGDGPLALPDPTACPSQKHKLALIPTGPALGRVGTLAWSSPRCLFAGLCRVGAGRHLGVCTDGPTTSQGCGPPQPKPLLSPAPCTRQHPGRRSTHSASLSAVFPSGPFPGASFPGSPLLHCVRAWGLRSRYTYSLCLCAIISVSGGARLIWGRRRQPSAWLCCCDYCTPSRCTVSMV